MADADDEDQHSFVFNARDDATGVNSRAPL